MFGHRALSAVVIVSATALFVYLGGIPFTLFITAIAIVAAYELGQMIERSGSHPLTTVSIAIVVALAFDAYLGAPLAKAIILVGILAPLVWQTLVLPKEGRGPGEATADWISTPLIGLYIGLPMSYFMLLRQASPSTAIGGLSVGIWWTVLAILGTWASDTGAYLTGMAFGRHGFMTHVSPKKTWEGAIGGMVWAIVVGAALGSWALGIGTLNGIIVGALIALVATLGDVGESMIKRGAGVKDTGTIIPGHGGLLDRIDSLIFTVPLVYYCMVLLHATSR